MPSVTSSTHKLGDLVVADKRLPPAGRAGAIEQGGLADLLDGLFQDVENENGRSWTGCGVRAGA